MNNNKIKTASKVALLVLAATAYVFLGSNQSGVEVDLDTKANVVLQDTMYQTIPHDEGGPVDPQQQGTRSQLESTFCTPGTKLCAVAVNPADPSNVIRWQGNSSKF